MMVSFLLENIRSGGKFSLWINSFDLILLIFLSYGG